MYGGIMRTFVFDSSAYSKSAILRACHHLSGQFDLSLENDEAGNWVVRLNSDDGSDIAARTLRQSVLDFTTRELIEAQTADIRTTLIQVALLEASPSPTNGR